MIRRKRKDWGKEIVRSGEAEGRLVPGKGSTSGRRCQGGGGGGSVGLSSMLGSRCWLLVDVAIAVVSQKFASDPALGQVLDATGDRVLAEMTKNDSYWGTGIDRSHADAQTPSAWPGTNILGYALMVARERLRARRAGSAPASSTRSTR